jgi:predicted glycosyltransferase
VRKVRCTRSAIIERTAIAFAPDLFVVDKRAGGIDNELLPALEALRRLDRPPRVVLGLRDILDAPETTSRSLRANGSFDLIERCYDEIWIYGARDVFDAVAEYNFPPTVAARSHFCGYLRRHAAPRTAHSGPPRILVTAGGGGDAAVLVLAYLRGLAQVPEGEFQTVVVLGPQLDQETAEGLRQLGAQRRDVEYVEFEANMPRRYERPTSCSRWRATTRSASCSRRTSAPCWCRGRNRYRNSSFAPGGLPPAAISAWSSRRS